MINVLKSLIKQFMPFAQKKMGFSRPPKLFLREDAENAINPLGKTGFYDPEAESITLYITGRHPKDIMRSLAHELMHHTQKCNGEFDNVQNMGEEGYAQADPHMRTMEIQAYQASIVFRDWEDSCKGTIYYEHLQKGDKSSMSTKDWKNGELKSLLSEAWGFKMDLSKLNEPKQEKLNENQDEIFAPNHYCVHHGGVQYNGKIHMAEAVNHNYDFELDRVTHYDMKLEDGTILENVPADEIQVTDATLAEMHHSGKRDDDHSPVKKDKKPKKKGKYDDGDGEDEKCDYVPCKGQEKQQEQIEEYSMKKEKKGDDSYRSEREKCADKNPQNQPEDEWMHVWDEQRQKCIRRSKSKKQEKKERVDEMGCPPASPEPTAMTVVDGDEAAVTDVDDAEGLANELLSVAQRIADMLGQDSSVTSLSDEGEEEVDLEERRVRSKKNLHIRGNEGSKLSENISKLKKAGYSNQQIKEFFVNAYSRALKG